jgi:cell division protein FtsL
MSEKKEEMVSKKVVIVFGVIIMVLFAGIIVVFAYFSSEVILRDNIIAVKDEEILDLESEIETLEEHVSDLQDQVEAQQNQIVNLERGPTGAAVINVGLGARDEHDAMEPYLYVSGYVCSVGSETAYNVRLHVTAYQGSVQAIDYYYEIADSLKRYDAEYVEARFYYSGPELTPGSWVMSPECTQSP